jgi:opacity protein-like surface antigen
MMKPMIAIAVLLLLCTAADAQPVDVYGYFEPQYNGIYFGDAYHQFQSNKLRVDLKSTAIANTEFGGDVVFLLYHGKIDWNILDFLPEELTSTIPPELRPFYSIKFEDTLYLDNVYARFAINRFAITAGKQQISLGTGYFANPTDIFNTKDALDPTYEQTGHNALRVDFQAMPRLNLMAIYSPVESDFEASGKMLRAKLGLGHFDISLLGSMTQYSTTDFYTFARIEEQRHILGGDIVGELVGMGVWAEGIYNFFEDTEDGFEFLVGTDYTFDSGLYTMLEYHHNSLAKSDHEDYDLNDWMRFFTGEAKTITSDQLYALLQYPLTDMLTIGSSAVLSVSDMSAAIIPMLQYSLFNNIELTLMGNIYIGEEGTAYSSSLGNGGFIRASVYF